MKPAHNRISTKAIALLALAPFLWASLYPAPAPAQSTSLAATLKWTAASGTLPTAPGAQEAYGGGLAELGDLDGNGVEDVAVGLSSLTSGDGRVWIQFLESDGSVGSIQSIGEGAGGFTSVLDTFDRFGRALACLGDVDGDGVVDLAVSAHGDDDGGSGRGALWVLFLNTDGTVKAEQKISSISGGFGGALDQGDEFGLGLAGLGDLDGDGVPDLLAAAPKDDDGGTDRGALYVLFLNADGTVRSTVKISDTVGAFFGQLDDGDFFGLDAVETLGDFDGDGLLEVAVGALTDDDGGTDRGALWILDLFPSGIVAAHTKISSTSGNLGPGLQDGDLFGATAACIGDVDGNGVVDLAVGAYGDSGLGTGERGAIWLLFLAADGSVLGREQLSEGSGGLGFGLDDGDLFGIDLISIADLDGNGQRDLVVGAFADDDDATDAGTAYVLFLDRCDAPASATVRNAGSNPQSYAADAPRLGEAWTATVDLSTTGHALALIVAFDAAIQFPLPGGQTLLVADGFGSGELLGLPALPGPLASFTIAVPYDPGLCGISIATQAAHLGGVTPFALANAVDLVFGI